MSASRITFSPRMSKMDCSIRLAGYSTIGIGGGNIIASGTRELCCNYCENFDAIEDEDMTIRKQADEAMDDFLDLDADADNGDGKNN